MLFSYYFDFSDIASVDENTAVAPNPDSSGFLRVNDSEKFVPHDFPKNLGFFGEEESAQRLIPILRDFFAKTIPKSLFRMVSRKILDFSERRNRRSA